jgi:hypothetical protein
MQAPSSHACQGWHLWMGWGTIAGYYTSIHTKQNTMNPWHHAWVEGATCSQILFVSSNGHNFVNWSPNWVFELLNWRPIPLQPQEEADLKNGPFWGGVLQQKTWSIPGNGAASMPASSMHGPLLWWPTHFWLLGGGLPCSLNKGMVLR